VRGGVAYPIGAPGVAGILLRPIHRCDPSPSPRPTPAIPSPIPSVTPIRQEVCVNRLKVSVLAVTFDVVDNADFVGRGGAYHCCPSADDVGTRGDTPVLLVLASIPIRTHTHPRPVFLP
jgi:hypothetical protein